MWKNDIMHCGFDSESAVNAILFYYLIRRKLSYYVRLDRFPD